MNELIEKQKEKLDKLEYEWECNCREQYTSIDKEDIYNWHINSIKEILEAEVKWLNDTCYPTDSSSYERGFNESSDETIKYLKNIINNLK